MSDRRAAKARSAMLKQLRADRQASVEATQGLLREQQATRKRLRAAMSGGPKTVPQIADISELPSELVLWHVTAMRKYEEVVETGMDGDYYLYQLASESSA
jgi:hypothetical protein